MLQRHIIIYNYASLATNVSAAAAATKAKIPIALAGQWAARMHLFILTLGLKPIAAFPNSFSLAAL